MWTQTIKKRPYLPDTSNRQIININIVCACLYLNLIDVNQFHSDKTFQWRRPDDDTLFIMCRTILYRFAQTYGWIPPKQQLAPIISWLCCAVYRRPVRQFVWSALLWVCWWVVVSWEEWVFVRESHSWSADWRQLRELYYHTTRSCLAVLNHLRATKV